MPVANPKRMLADKGYDGDDVRGSLRLPRLRRRQPHRAHVQQAQAAQAHRHLLRQSCLVLPRLPQHRRVTHLGERLCQQDLATRRAGGRRRTVARRAQPATDGSCPRRRDRCHDLARDRAPIKPAPGRALPVVHTRAPGAVDENRVGMVEAPGDAAPGRGARADLHACRREAQRCLAGGHRQYPATRTERQGKRWAAAMS